MSLIKITNFGGEVPRLTKRNLPDSASQICENLLADTAEFRPLNTDVPGGAVTNMPPGLTCRTLYRYPTTSVNSFGTDLQISLVRSQIAGDAEDRVYMSMLSSDPNPHGPKVLQSGSLSNVPLLRDLGVPQPTPLLGLSYGSPSGTLLSPAESIAGELSLMEQIRNICRQMIGEYWWNPSFDLAVSPGFRELPDAPAGEHGIWQRVFGVYAATPTGAYDNNTWVTFNGTAIERHLWMTGGTMPIPYRAETAGFMGSGSANRSYYGNFRAKVRYFAIIPDVTTLRGALLSLLIPGTSEAAFLEADADRLIGVLQALFPADPLDSSSMEIRSGLTTFQSTYNELVGFLKNGFGSDVSPSLGFAKVSQAQAASQAAADSVAAFYDDVFSRGLNAAVTAYFDETRFTDKFSAGETEIVDERFYIHTWVNSWGEESAPCPVAEESFPVNQYQVARVTRSGTVPANITKWRLYRSAAGTDSASFLLVKELPAATTVYDDVVQTAALGESIQTTAWTPPPTHGDKPLRHLVALPGGFMAGFVENTVYFSEPYHPYAWPSAYAVVCESDVLALGVFGNTVVALTKRGPEYVSGSSPDSMSKVKLESNEVCQSPRSVVPVQGGVIFASQNGMCLASQQGVQNMTQALWTHQDWSALQPHEFICEELGGVLYMGHGGGLALGSLHLPTGKFTRVDTAVTAFYSDYYNGTLFAALPPAPGGVANFVALVRGTAYRTARWRSKRMVLEKESGFAWCAVEGEQSVANPLTIDLWGYYMDGDTEVEVLLSSAKASDGRTAVVTDTAPFRVGVGRFKDFEVQISGKCRVTSVLFASSSDELKGVN